MQTKLPSTAAGRKRLLKLSGLLMADARKRKGVKFDLETWAKPSSTGWSEHYKSREAAKPNQGCGTAACAVGLACLNPTFNKQGLTFAVKKIGFLEPQYMAVPALGRRRDWSAVLTFFALKPKEAMFLFVSNSYRKSKGAAAERAVAKRIRDFVAGKVAPAQRRGFY